MSDDGLVVQLGDQPLTGIDGFGVKWMLTDFGDWYGSTSSTLALIQKGAGPGAWKGPRQLTPKTLAPAGLVEAASLSDLRDALDRLNAAASLNGTVLSVSEDDQTRTMSVYRQDVPLHTLLTDTLAQWSLALVAPDPRKYGPQIVASTGLPNTSGGLTWPVSWPIEWTGVVTSGALHIENPGNIESPIVIRIDGPCTGPRIRHDSSGIELVFASSYDLAAGSFLLIDMENKQVLEGGTASRNQWISDRGWFALEPGGNDLIFSAASYNPDARMTVTTAPAYQ